MSGGIRSYLPDSGPPEEAQKCMGSKNRCEILLVGHEREVHASLYAALQARAYAVTRACRGEEALAKALQLNLDVVVSDLVVPGLSGLELLAKLQSAKPRLPVILFTEKGSTEAAIEATRLGAYDFIAKPFEISEVVDLVAQATASNGWVLFTYAVLTVTNGTAIGAWQKFYRTPN